MHHEGMDLDWSALGKALQQARLEQGLTQDALAKKAGVARQSLISLERGEARTRMPASLPKVEKALGWPAGRAVAALQGRVHSVTVVRELKKVAKEVQLDAEISRSVEHAVIATSETMTAAQIKELAQKVVEDLRSRGVI